MAILAVVTITHYFLAVVEIIHDQRAILVHGKTIPVGYTQKSLNQNLQAISIN
jgi:hypothetical protein